jgi:hypothetical protein
MQPFFCVQVVTSVETGALGGRLGPAGQEVTKGRPGGRGGGWGQPKIKMTCLLLQRDVKKGKIPHCKENLFYVFLFWVLLGLSPHIHVSVSDLYFPRIGPHISLQQNRQTNPGNI